MIPLGVLASAHRETQAPPVATITPVFRGASAPPTTASTSTYAAVPLGPESPTRTVIVMVTSWTAGTRALTGVTVGGIQAGIDAISGRLGPCGVFRATVPTGATADVVVSTQDDTVLCAIAVWTVDGDVVPVSYVIPASVATGATSMEATIPDTVAGGFALAAHRSRSGIFTTEWTNATERYDSAAAQPYSGADAVTAGGPLTITATPSVATTSTSSILAIAYRPSQSGGALTYRDTLSSVIAAATTHTFTGVPIGPESPTRTVIVIAAAKGSSVGRNISGATFNGAAATRDAFNSGYYPIAVFREVVPLGSTMDLAVTVSVAATDVVVHVYTAPTAVTLVDKDSPPPMIDPTVTLLTSAGGVVITGIGRASIPPVWSTNVVQDASEVVTGSYYAAASTLTDGTEMTIAATSGTAAASLAAVSYLPA